MNVPEHKKKTPINIKVVIILCFCIPFYILWLLLVGFNFSIHARPGGHGDVTIAMSPADDAILFSAVGNGRHDLYLLELETLKVRQITDTPDYETVPRFSPDGDQIVFASGRTWERADHIFVMNIDGTSRKQLTFAEANDTSPRFSPDGKAVVFARDKTYNWGGLAANWALGGVICVVNTDGTGERQLTADETKASNPMYTPDGDAVVYFTDDGCYRIGLEANAQPEKVGRYVKYADLSLDGKRLVYGAGKYSPDFELFIANLDGADKTQITQSDEGCFHPVFTNAGDRVYYLLNQWPDGGTGRSKMSIWSVRTDGTDQKQITDVSLFDAPMEWKP